MPSPLLFVSLQYIFTNGVYLLTKNVKYRRLVVIKITYLFRCWLGHHKTFLYLPKFHKEDLEVNILLVHYSIICAEASLSYTQGTDRWTWKFSHECFHSCVMIAIRVETLSIRS